MRSTSEQELMLEDLKKAWPKLTWDNLPPRHVEVAYMWAKGYSVARTASELHLAVDSVGSYRVEIKHALIGYSRESFLAELASETLRGVHEHKWVSKEVGEAYGHTRIVLKCWCGGERTMDSSG